MEARVLQEVAGAPLWVYIAFAVVGAVVGREGDMERACHGPLRLEEEERLAALAEAGADAVGAATPDEALQLLDGLGLGDERHAEDQEEDRERLQARQPRQTAFTAERARCLSVGLDRLERVHATVARVLVPAFLAAVLLTAQIVRRGISMVPENRRLFSNMTVSENLDLGAYQRKDKAKIASMKTDLRNFVSAQEGHFADFAVYATAHSGANPCTPTAASVCFAQTLGNSVLTIVATVPAAGYSATITNTSLSAAKTCGVFGGNEAPPNAAVLQEGAPACW